MKLFDVYPLLNIEPVRGEGCYIFDSEGNQYLDMYGGHAVISIGHSHPTYIRALTQQLEKIGFYSNSVLIPQQQELACRLGRLSGCDAYHLFLCNSGAEANENAIKLASFHNGRAKVLAMKSAFHGRTHGAVTATDNPQICAPVNSAAHVTRIPLNDLEAATRELQTQAYCCLIVEGIQGLAGIYTPQASYLQALRKICSETGTVLILDEVQSGYGRAGKFFAFQYSGIEPDLITTAKGMGNGFPIGGVLISPVFEAKYGLLGTTFGGSHLACAAGIAVLEVMEQEHLVDNAASVGSYLIGALNKFSALKEVRGCGLMIGLEFDVPIAPLRKKLIEEHKVFTGTSSNKNVLRLLPPLSFSKSQADQFLDKLDRALKS